MLGKSVFGRTCWLAGGLAGLLGSKAAPGAVVAHHHQHQQGQFLPHPAGIHTEWQTNMKTLSKAQRPQ